MSTESPSEFATRAIGRQQVQIIAMQVVLKYLLAVAPEEVIERLHSEIDIVEAGMNGSDMPEYALDALREVREKLGGV